MKKHFSILAITLMALVLVFGSCKKDPKPTPSDSKEYTVKYKISNTASITNPLTGEVKTYTLSPCFKFNFSYVDADGRTVEKTNVTAPWEETITVHRPFNAKMEGELVYNESELPDTVYYGTPYSITISGNGTILHDNDENIARTPKDRFLEHIAGTDRLKFEGKVSLN